MEENSMVCYSEEQFNEIWGDECDETQEELELSFYEGLEE